MKSQSGREPLKRSLESSVARLDAVLHDIASDDAHSTLASDPDTADVLASARFALANFDVCSCEAVGGADPLMESHYLNSLASLRGKAAHAADATSGSTDICVYAYSNAMRRVSDAAWQIFASF